VAAQVERLRGFVGALGLGRVHLGGNSMGGFIVAEYAARYPAEVASLWLLDPAGTAAALDTPMLRHYAQTGEIPLLVREPGAYSDLLAAATHRPVFVPPSLRRVLAARAAADFTLHERIFRQVRQESPLLEPLLPSIVAPTLIVWGAADHVLNPAAGAVLHRAIAGSELELMAGVGHLPMLERPRACALRYLRFRARAAAPSPR
jgi:pimeloyl-ACP methyl ester carboxylesterase